MELFKALIVIVLCAWASEGMVLFLYWLFWKFEDSELFKSQKKKNVIMIITTLIVCSLIVWMASTLL